MDDSTILNDLNDFVDTIIEADDPLKDCVLYSCTKINDHFQLVWFRDGIYAGESSVSCEDLQNYMDKKKED